MLLFLTLSWFQLFRFLALLLVLIFIIYAMPLDTPLLLLRCYFSPFFFAA